MKKILLLIFIILNSFIFAHEVETTTTYTVAFSQDTMDNDFRFNQVKEVQKALSKYPNITFLYSDAKANASLQIKQIEDFIYQDVDLLMVSAYDEVSASIATSKAYRAGIPVILVGRKVRGDDYTTHIHPDNKKIAKDAAKYILKKLNYKGTILLLRGVPTAEPSRQRTEGFYEVVNKHPKVRVIERIGNYLRRDAIIEVDKLLTSGVKLDAIMSQSDSMLVGARMALSSHKIDSASIITVGIDYIKPAKEAILKGKQNSSFLYSLCAKESALVAVKILSGKKVPKEIKINTLQITKENVNNVKPIF